jgi:hypothetical protein
MNISWGYKITALYVSFVVLIVTMVFISMQQNVELESKDYYAQELKYQQRINAVENANRLTKSIRYEVHGRTVEITYPQEVYKGDFSGEITFFRPSDASKDFKVNMTPSTDGLQSINSSRFERGSYKMQLSWKKDGKQFFKEEVIFIQ